MYRYETIDADGHRETGIVKIEDYTDALEYVRKNYGMIVALEKVEATSLRGGSYTDQQRTYFFKQLSVVLQSGIPLLQGLEVISEAKDKKIVHICKQLSVRIANGQSVSQAMSALPEFFTELCITLVRAGEDTGELPKMAGELADYFDKKVKLQSFLERIIIYPATVLVVGLAVLLLFLLVVLPTVGSMYGALKAPVSGSLAFMLELQKLLLQWWYLVLLVGVVFFVYVYRRRQNLLQLFLRLPLVRDFYRDLLEIRFCKLWALLLNGGIDMLQAISTASLVVTDKSMYLSLQNLRQQLAKGVDLGTYLEEHKEVFTPAVRAFVVVGNRTGNLTDMLQQATEMQESALTEKMEKAKEYLAPVLLIMVAFLIGFIVLSVMQPIFNLFGAVPEYQ